MAVISRKYNPGFLSDDDLVASFCVRTNEFASIVEMLRECTGRSNPHQIVIGPRGSGKTSLLLRIAAEVRRDAGLSSRLFPIVFAEESYEVATGGEFWLECLSRLAAQVPPREGDPDLQHTVEELRAVHDDRTLAERCLGALLDFSDREGRRLVLMVENLNMMLRDMMDPDAGWQLRKILQTEPRIVLLASATSQFDEIDSPDQALYDLFRVRTLRPLDTNECAALWETVSGRCPAPETIRSLEILTGGSPRLLAIVARFGARLSFRELMADLLDLVDDHTGYFKSHLESLPAQERRVYLALADLWKPATTREIADRARLETSKCSAQLTRLAERGVVKVAGGTAKRKQYYLIERLYNIYYLLRRNRGPDRLIDALIRFMASYYSPPELKEIGARIIGEARGLDTEMRSLQLTVLARLMALSALEGYSEELNATVLQDLEKVLDQRTTPADAARPTSAGMRPDDRRADRPHETTDVPAERGARDLFETTAALSAQSRPEDALAACDGVVRRFGESEIPAVLVWVAKAIVNKGVLLGGMNRPQAALAAYDEVIRRFEQDDTPVFLEPVARAFVFKGTVLDGMNRPQEALAAYDEVVRRFGESGTPAILESVAMALGNKAIVLQRRLNRTKDALAAWDEVVRRFGDGATPVLSESVAKALVNKGAALQELNQPQAALAACNEVERRFGAVETPSLPEPIATARVNRGAVLVALNRPEEALAVWDEVVRRFGTSETPILLTQVAMAFVNKGSLLAQMNRPDEALTVWDEVVRRFGEIENPILLEPVAQALVNKGSLLAQMNRPQDALAAWEEGACRVGAGETPILMAQVAKSLINRGTLLASMNRPQDALAAWDEVVRRFGEIENPILLEPVAQALVNKGAMLGELDRPHDALVVCDEVERRFAIIETPAVLDLVASALINKGVALGALNRLDDALVVWEDLARRFGASECPARRALTERALIENAALELKAGRHKAAFKMAGLALDQHGTDSAENRWLGHLIRARSSLASGNPSAFEQDIIASLAILPELGSITRDDLDALMKFSIELGPEHMRELIQASPSATLLLPFTTALEQELGLEPRVALEIEEVAQDIRRDLAKLKEREPMATNKEQVKSLTAVRPPRSLSGENTL